MGIDDMDELRQLREEIASLRERNIRVEADKAWEISTARKVLIAVLTYIVVVLFFLVANLPNPFVSALVPTIGFVLSTLSITIFKKLWLKRGQAISINK